MTEGLTLDLRRVLPASRLAVYEALTNPERLALWWGPQGFTSPDVRFHPHVGGGYRIAMQPPQGDPFFLLGEFHAVDPLTRLVFSFRWDPPDPDDRDTLVTLSLQDQGEETEVHLTQASFATEERRALHEQGWIESLDRLEKLLSGSP